MFTWRERFASSELPGHLHAAIDMITTGDWDLYNRFLLKPVLRTQFHIAKIAPPGAAPITFVLATLLALHLIGILLKRLSRRGSAVRRGVLVFGVRLPLELLVAVPTIGSLVLLSHGRLEDRYFVAGLLDSSLVQTAPMFEEGFDFRTSLWLALLVAAATVARYVLNHLWVIVLAKLPDDVQEDVFEELDPVNIGLLLLSTYHQDVSDLSAGAPFKQVTHGLYFRGREDICL